MSSPRSQSARRPRSLKPSPETPKTLTFPVRVESKRSLICGWDGDRKGTALRYAHGSQHLEIVVMFDCLEDEIIVPLTDVKVRVGIGTWE